MGKSAGRRLSKPQCINSSSSTLLDLLSPPIDTSSPLTSDTDYFSRVSTKTDDCKRRRRSQSRPKLRAYLYGTPSSSSIPLSSDEEAETSPNHLTEVARKAHKRLSRSGSLFTQLSTTKDSTVQSPNNSTSVLAETKDAEELSVVVQAIKERAQKDSQAADLHKQSSSENGVLSDALCPPVRRKSLYTPGLAKRDASDILRKPVEKAAAESENLLSEADRNYYYNPSHPESSPLSCLAALRLSEDGRATPSSFNVPNLGGIRLGNLVVTNGLGSPTCQSPSPSCAEGEEYQTASEGSIHEREKIFEEECAAEAAELIPLAVMQPKSKKPEPELSFPEHKEGNHDPSVASAMAREYIAELANGPFEPHLSTKASGGEDEYCYDDEDDKFSESWKRNEGPIPAIPTHEPKIYLEEDIGYLTSRDYDERSLRQPFSREDTTQAMLATPIEDYKTQSLECTHTTDSGYQSTESFDEGSTCSPAEKSANCTDLAWVPTVEHHEAGLENPPTSIARLEKVTEHKPIRRLQKPRPKPASNFRDSINLHSHHLSQVSIPRVPSILALQLDKRNIECPILEHTFPSSNHTKISESPRLVHAKPEIRFPSPDCKNSANSRLSGDGRLPLTQISPPWDNRDKHQETEPLSSDLMCSATWSGFGSRNNSKESKKLVKRAEEGRRRREKEQLKCAEQERKKDEETLRQQAKRSRSRSRSLSRWRGKSADRRLSLADEEITIADFGTVAESIGCSPYDVSTCLLGRNQSQGQKTCHPYQLGVARRPQSFVGMSDADASAFARRRSRLSMQKQRRSGSFCDSPSIEDRQTFNDRGGVPGRMLRTYSGVWDAPSVPSLTPASVNLKDTTPASQSSCLDGQTPSSATSDSSPGAVPDWEQHRQAWYQRRRSAGEALLAQSREANQLQNSLLEAQINMHDNAMETSRSTMGPSVASMVGRFEGGLGYGYEGGHGVGGSAGTRSLASTASRKGIEVSRGTGLDLSDLPVFIARGVK